MTVSESLLTLEADDTPSVIRDRPSALRRSRDVSLLLVAVAIILLSLTLRVRADQRIEFLGLSGLTAPETCGLRMLFGLECPGCGLTRGFIRMATGDWSGAIVLNRVTPLLALAVLLQIPYRLALLLAWPPALRFGDSVWSTACGWVLIVALFANWLLTLLGL